jgi:hypothetical protein
MRSDSASGGKASYSAQTIVESGCRGHRCAGGDVVTAFVLSQEGFTVLRGVGGLPTAFTATTGDGPLHVVIRSAAYVSEKASSGR